MALANDEARRAYQRDYSKDRYDIRMAAMHDALGGKCAKCGVTTDLEIHHIDPEVKSFDLSTGHARPWPTVLEELKKCELRCSDHHKEEHEARHGTISRYRSHRCRCEPCKEAWNIKCREWKATWKKKKYAHVTGPDYESG